MQLIQSLKKEVLEKYLLQYSLADLIIWKQGNIDQNLQPTSFSLRH